MLLRKLGIRGVEDVSWGTHYCVLYEDKDTLAEILIPYFKAGLENNESCLWIVSELINEEEAMKLLKASIPDFEKYIEKGQFEIVLQTEWYFENGIFDSERVLVAWADKINRALEEGFDGLRVSGDSAWIGEEVGERAFEYEKQVTSIIKKYKMIALCSYMSCEKTGDKIMGAMYAHQCTIGKKDGEIKAIAYACFSD